MSQAYRLGFELSSPDDRHSIADARWALAGTDPAADMRTGAFDASDGAAVPYRLWRAKTPRALILLLHGACDYGGAFDEIGPLFAARGFTALAIDQRGFGATATRGRWRGKNRMIRDAIEAVIFLRMRFGEALPVFLLGESMGAALAVHAAARAPDLDLAGIVLAAPGAISGTWRRLFGSALTRVLRFFAPNAGIVIERISAWDFTPGAAIRLLSDPMVLRRIRPAILFGLFKLSRSAVDEAEHVRVPALTMIGGKEELLREACIARLHHGLAGEKEWARFKHGPHLLLHWKWRDRVLDKVFSWAEARLTAAAPAYKIAAASGAIRA
ncbi:MAG TPA: alpha/beta fold hydrolase [Rhizomicrobium sp.]|jgi:acylglycerol lipase|nr:alpha/beta fold hydrolase [Rhizomicrobium sp.]